MMSGGLILATNQNTAAPVGQQNYNGGASVLTIVASSYPTTCNLQVLASDNVTWVNLGSNITANGCTQYFIPQGQIRLNLSGGTCTGLYATLVPVAYG